MIRWRGEGFDPNTVDDDNIEKDLEKLRRRWSRNKAKMPRVKSR